jgi:hypothetical protein
MPITRAAARYKTTSAIATSTVANVAVETNFAQNVVIPANSMKPGKTYRLTVRGLYSTIVSSPGTLNIRLKFGSAALVGTNALTLSTNLVNRGWEFTALLTVISVGASGQIEIQGRSFLNTTGTAAIIADPKTTPATVNMTQAQTLQVSAEWSVADAGNTITARNFILEELG